MRIAHGAFMPCAAISFRQNEAVDSGMLDVAYITLALVSFALFALAVRGCERL
jgi:hypothetical protein